jgi:hypothetical protein
MPPHWREWLGTIRTQEVEGSNLFLLSKMRSRAPDILDGENAELKRRAGHFYSGILLASPFAPAHSPVMLSGSRRHGEIGVRSQDNYEPAIPSMVRHYPPVTLADLQLAAKVAEQIAALEGFPPVPRSAGDPRQHGPTASILPLYRWADRVETG